MQKPQEELEQVERQEAPQSPPQRRKPSSPLSNTEDRTGGIRPASANHKESPSRHRRWQSAQARQELLVVRCSAPYSSSGHGATTFDFENRG